MTTDTPEVQLVQVTCDGPDCTVTATAPAGDDPQPDGWLKAWGVAKLGRFDFHSGACYDAWRVEQLAAVPAPEPQEEAAT